MSAVHKLCWWKAQGSGSPCQLLHSLVPRSNSVISVYWERGGDGDEDDRNCSKTGVQIKIDWYPKVVCLKEMNLFLPSVKLTWCRQVHPENVSWGDISWRLKRKVSLASAFPKLLQQTSLVKMTMITRCDFRYARSLCDCTLCVLFCQENVLLHSHHSLTKYSHIKSII